MTDSTRRGSVESALIARSSLKSLPAKETRCVVLGHLQRGGRPNAFDRMLATNYGSCAVRALVEGKRGVMVALQAGDVITVPICQAIANIKTVPADGQLVRTARDTGISFGAPDEASYHRQSIASRVRDLTIADQSSDVPNRTGKPSDSEQKVSELIVGRHQNKTSR